MKYWKPYTPSPDNPWDLRKAGHLLRRAAFGGTRAELDVAVKVGPDAAVEALFHPRKDEEFETTSAFMASERSLPAGAPTRQLAAWWLYRLLKSPDPLREKLCLFWHNHFATSNAKVLNARYMLGQYETISRHALGSFQDLLHAITLDPAMMVWLDTIDSKKGMPNENYARELMELFSLGIGQYTETDIREAAKAFTGYSLKSGRSSFNVKDHDAGEKRVFSRKGQYQSNDIVDLCLQQPACPKYIAGKLYKAFISETMDSKPGVIEELAGLYQDRKYNTKYIVGVILRSDLFYSPTAYRQRVKSPVEFAVGIVRALEGNVGPLPLAESLEGLGQVLFAPPSVKGWDGGMTWLNAQTVLHRQNLALALTSTDDARFGRRCDPAQVWKEHKDEEVLDSVLKLFVQDDIPAASREKLQQYLTSSKSVKAPPFWTKEDIRNHRIRSLTHLVLSLPEYQLN